ncbi:cytochrome c3 family protein [Desulfurivibrio sp. D14AmB]|uniref:cytochrome c3 family protein n=1 Tax=Desulfurivibrio sp. D14AmB TaxID=3374370 RepID=UPI00376F3BDC
MRFYLPLTLVLVLAASTALLVTSAQEAHRFTAEECLICHTEAEGSLDNLRPEITEACATCHPSAGNYQSHPTDIIPKMAVPGDMLLVEGLFTCVSCHDVHARGNRWGKPAYFLRRSVDGRSFCLICHEVDQKGHLFIGATHGGQFIAEPQGSGSNIDPITLRCIGCHDERIADLHVLGSGSWNHASGNLNHPVGVSYRQAYRKRPLAYVPPEALGKEIELFEGNIGCGTCHSRYSPRNFMLVMSNQRSALCFSCHIK